MAYITEQKRLESTDLENRIGDILASFNLQIDLKRMENFVIAKLEQRGIEITCDEVRLGMISLLRNGIFEIKELATPVNGELLFVNVNFRRPLSY